MPLCGAFAARLIGANLAGSAGDEILPGTTEPRAPALGLRRRTGAPGRWRKCPFTPAGSVRPLQIFLISELGISREPRRLRPQGVRVPAGAARTPRPIGALSQ